jgi:hypothetical protein
MLSNSIHNFSSVCFTNFKNSILVSTNSAIEAYQTLVSYAAVMISVDTVQNGLNKVGGMF